MIFSPGMCGRTFEEFTALSKIQFSGLFTGPPVKAPGGEQQAGCLVPLDCERIQSLERGFAVAIQPLLNSILKPGIVCAGQIFGRSLQRKDGQEIDDQKTGEGEMNKRQVMKFHSAKLVLAPRRHKLATQITKGSWRATGRRATLVRLTKGEMR